MTNVPVQEKMTAGEFLALAPPEGAQRRELIDGEVVVNEPAVLHVLVQTNLLVALAVWTRAQPLRGQALIPLDVELDEHDVFVPDVLWYAHGRVPDPSSSPPYPVPDVAAEVRSPSTWQYDIGAKKAQYEREGLPELWLVDTLVRKVLVFRRSRPGGSTFDVAVELGEADELASPLLPGFALAVAEVFRLS